MNVNDRIRQYVEDFRKSEGYGTVTEFARAVGVSQPTMARFLDGKQDYIREEFVMSLCRAMGITIDEYVAIRDAAPKPGKRQNRHQHFADWLRAHPKAFDVCVAVATSHGYRPPR